MEKVLFIAHHFPPMGGPGTNRSLQFVRLLPAFGYEPIVLTIDVEDVEASRYPLDSSLLEIVENAEIVRTPTREPRRLKRFLSRYGLMSYAWFLFYPIFWEESALWPFSAYRTALRLIHRHKISLIYTTSGPFSSMLLGMMLKATTGVRWVADIRDPFTDAFTWQWPSKMHWHLCRFIERIVFRFPDKVIVVTPGMRNIYLDRGLVQEEQVEVITNGF